jgi:hypothetical protein
LFTVKNGADLGKMQNAHVYVPGHLSTNYKNFVTSSNISGAMVSVETRASKNETPLNMF